MCPAAAQAIALFGTDVSLMEKMFSGAPAQGIHAEAAARVQIQRCAHA